MPGPVLVTGASGFVGTHLVEHLSKCGIRTVAWRRDTIDLLDRDLVRKYINDLNPETIYHCAGAPHVASSWDDGARPFESNVLATHYLLDAIRRTGKKCRILLPGSATVYQPSTQAVTEEHPIEPSSPYAISKLAQEKLGIKALAEDSIEVILTRSFNHTGPRQAPSFAAPSFARQLALIESGRVEPIIKTGNLNAQRDITDVRDVVRAYHLLMEQGRPGVLYNVCSGVAYAISDVLDELRQNISCEVQVSVDQKLLRKNDTDVQLGDPSRINSETGWTPTISFNHMLKDLLNYWKQTVKNHET